jgi:predicted aldo/keto reductase-like oxidoreductase
VVSTLPSDSRQGKICDKTLIKTFNAKPFGRTDVSFIKKGIHMTQKIQRKLQRREFLCETAKSIAVVGLAVPMMNVIGEKDQTQDSVQTRSVKKPAMEYRLLGNTKLKVTTIGYGAMRTDDEAVIHHALDRGINYIDTARVYMGGQNEVIVGHVMKTRRKEAYLATKFRMGTEAEIKDSVDTSLRSLQTDYVDIIQAHGLNTVNEVQNETMMNALIKLKKEGKIRFCGFTTHRNQVELINAAIPMKFYDIILAAYNFKSPVELTTAIEEAAKAGIGIIAMKTQAGGYSDSKMGNLSPHQAALKWVLQNRGIATAIPSMVNYDQIDENVQVMGSKMGWMDRKMLHRYSQAIDSVYCRMCDRCRNQCPKGVDIQEINRSLMYHEGYRDIQLARFAFKSIPPKSRPMECVACSTCSVVCAYGLNVQAKMKKALTLFT